LPFGSFLSNMVGLCPVLSFRCPPKVVTEPDHGISHYLLTFRDERLVFRVLRTLSVDETLAIEVRLLDFCCYTGVILILKLEC